MIIDITTVAISWCALTRHAPRCHHQPNTSTSSAALDATQAAVQTRQADQLQTALVAHASPTSTHQTPNGDPKNITAFLSPTLPRASMSNLSPVGGSREDVFCRPERADTVGAGSVANSWPVIFSGQDHCQAVSGDETGIDGSRSDSGKARAEVGCASVLMIPLLGLLVND